MAAFAASFLLQSVTLQAQAPAAAAPAFRIQTEWKLGGPGGWGPMLFDPATRQLFIPRTNRVSVIDTETGKILGEVPGFGDARNVALDQDGKYGYVTDIMDGTVGIVRVFNRSTFQVESTIEVGRIPGAILFDPITKNVFSFNSRERTASVIGSASKLVSATIPLHGKPHLAVTDGKGSIYVTFRTTGDPEGKIVRLDTTSHAITATWSIEACAEFTGLAMDAPHHQLLGGCADGHLLAIDAASGHVTDLGEKTTTVNDAADLTLDGTHGLLFAGSNRGNLTILHQDSASHFTRLQDLPTLPRASTLVPDPIHGRVYLITATFDKRPVNGKNLDELEARQAPVTGTFEVIVVGK